MSDAPPTVSESEFEDMELSALHNLSEYYRENGGRQISLQDAPGLLGIEDREQARKMFWHVKRLGAISEGVVLGKPVYGVDGTVLEISKRREAEVYASRQPADKVAKAESWLRRHPYWSVAFITLIVVTFVVTLANQLLQLVNSIFGKG
jgi:hypothetical protein